MSSKSCVARQARHGMAWYTTESKSLVRADRRKACEL